MAKRRKTIYAGRLVYDVIYTVATPRTDPYTRKKIRAISSEAVARTNCRTATRKLELTMACGFEPEDLVVTLTYRDADLPDCYAKALRKLQRFLRDLRAARALAGQELRYIHVTEGRHGDHRIHHHVIINSTGADLEVIRSLWKWGDDIQINTIAVKGYGGWAEYLSKERREASLNGKRMFTPSRNIPKPEVEISYVDDATTIEPPMGATLLDDSSDRNEVASYRYLKYLQRQRRRKVKSSNFSDLKPSITSRPCGRKRGRSVDERRPNGV